MRRFHTYIGVIMTDSNFNNPYEQIWKTRNLRDLNTNVELDNQRSEFRRGLGAFGKEMQATGYGLAALGAQGLENVIGENDVTSGIVDWGLEGYNKSIEESHSGLNAPSVANIEGIKTASDAMDWAGYQLGKGLPMLGSLALSGGIGGAVARLGAKEGVKQLAKAAVGSAVKKGIETKALKAVEGQVVTKAMQQAAAKSLRDTITKGAVAGGFAGSFGLEGGLAFGEQTAEGVNPADAVKSAIAVGGINGALEFLPFYSAAKSIGLGQYAKKSISSIIKNSPDLSKTAINLAKEVGGRATKGAIVGAGAEGITEGLQELVSIAGLRWAQQDPIFADLSNDDWARIGNAAAAGALVGGVAMGAGATLGGPQVQSTNTPQNESPLTGEVIPKENKLLGVDKTKQQVIEGVLEKVNTDLVIAQEEGNTARVEELQKAKGIYENALERMQEKTTLDVVSENTSTTRKEITQPEQDVRSTVQPEIQQAVESLREKQEPVNVESVQKELINLQQAENVLDNTLTPEEAALQQPEIQPIEETANGQEVQAQTEAEVNPLLDNSLTTTTEEDDVGGVSTSATMEEFEAVRRQFQERQSQTPFKKWFGTGTPGVTATNEGEPITLYHGTNNPVFFEWDSTKAGEASGHPTSGLGFFMTADKGAAARYGNNLLALHAKINNPYTLTDADLTRIDTPQDAAQLRKELMSKGYDGAVVTAPGASPYVIAFQANQIKLENNTTPTDSPDMRYSKPLQENKASAPFYSALERATQEVKQEKAPANQWLGTLDTMVKKGIIKQEELDWSGTKEWLQEQKGPVTKEALLQHVRDNTLNVQETELGPDQARNTKWTLPGGENQRELVLTVPSIESFNTDDTTHYGDVEDGRAVAWVRFNDRVDGEGKKTLFLEEVQSKRHQEGKDKGYSTKEDVKKLEQLKESVDQRMEALDIEPGEWITEEELARMPEDLHNDWKLIYGLDVIDKELVSDAPFKQTIAGSGQNLSGWAGLAFKRMLRYAAENGYDKVAWTTGEQQAKRYNLAKRVSKVAYSTDGFFEAYDKNGLTIISRAMAKDELPNYIGKDLAENLLSSPVKNEQHTVELSEDKIIGGEGMKGFYDRLLPNEINKYIKKWGAKVDKTQMEFGDETADVHSVEVTPAMRDSVMQGQSLFSKETEKTSQQLGAAKVTLQDLQSNIDSVMGQGWLQQAQELGLVEVVEGAGPNGEAGSWAGDRIRLYTDTMPKNGSPIGVLLHEGKHVTFEDVLGNTLPSYVKDLHTLANNGNKVARDAITHAAIVSADILGIEHNLREGGTKEDLDAIRALIEEKRPGLLAEEELAYFVQYGSEGQNGTGFLRRLINQIKAWFAQTKLGQRLKEMNVGFEMTEGMAVEWAKMGLHNSLNKLIQDEKINAQVLQKAVYMQPSARLGRALDSTTNDPLYSMGIKEFKETLWNDPTDARQEIVNKPGLLQRWRADFVDFFAEIEKKAPDIYDTFSLMRNKKAARVEQAHQEYLLPLRDLIVNSPWASQEVGDMLAARHLKLDNVNLGLAERASDDYVRRLIGKLPKNKTQGIVSQARKNIKAGKMPDGSEYLDNNGQQADMSAKTKRKLMFDLMNQYASLEIPVNGKQELLEEWERFKDAAGGFSSGGVAKGMVRTIDEVLELSKKDQAKFDEITKVFDAMNRHTLQILEDGGLITASEHARLLADKTAYAPLRRESYDVNREIELLFQRAGQGGSKQISTRTGTAALSEPTLVLQNALAQVETAAAAAERNLANTELYKTVVADKKGWQPWFSIVDKDKYTTHDEDGFLQEKNATASNKADINLIYKGKKVVIRPNMHNERAIGFVRAVNNLDAQILSGPMKVMNWINGIVRWVNVSASPIFLMMNAVRDPFTAAYNMQASEAAPYTKEIFENYGKSFNALSKVFMQGDRNPADADVQLVERFENAGGRTSFVESLKAMDSTWRSFDGQVALRKGNFKHLMSVKDKWIDGIENFNILFENVMRLSTFDTLTSKGISEQRAARIAQDLTTNFTRRGYKTQALGTWWLFFNATVQGNYQVVRNLMSSARVQTAVGGTIAFALMLDLFSRAVAPDDWDKIPAWDKERFIVLPIKIGGDFVKIPSPWVFNVFWRMGGLLGEALSGVTKPQDTVLDVAAMVSTTFSPIGRPGSFAQAIAPTAADPFVQILENKDFAGNPLGPEGYPGASKKANSELIWGNTPKGYQSFARWVNEATGGSAVESGGIDLRPADYQLLAKFLTGSLGRFMSDATFGVKEALTKGIEGPKDIPIIKELFSDPYDPIKTQKYHENIAEIYGAKKLEQMYIKGSERDLIKLHEIRQTRGTELGMYAQAQDVERQLKSLRARVKAAQNRKDETRVKELRDRMGKIQEQFNQRVEQRMR